jgi:hypothetical protein
MAQDLYSNLPPEIVLQQQGLNRQQEMAKALLAQGAQQNMGPAGQMVSGRYVPNSFFQNLQGPVNQMLGAYLAKQGDTKAAELAKQLREGRNTAEEKILQQMTGYDKTTELAGPYAGNVPQPTAVQRIEPDLPGALREIRTNPYGAGKEYTPTILKQMMPEDTSDYKNFLKVKAEFDTKGIPITFNQYQDIEANRKRPVTNVSVNTGQHGFDNALKLRTDFRNEPIYKGFEEVKSANNQIKQAAAMATPAGDLAAATKIMKILDPGSVVRESELGMAMAASGLADRATNYANMIITGQKLTPTQRKDFTELGQQLYNISAEQFNVKRNEYASIAERNKLDVDTAVGATAPINQGGWRIK